MSFGHSTVWHEAQKAINNDVKNNGTYFQLSADHQLQSGSIPASCTESNYDVKNNGNYFQLSADHQLQCGSIPASCTESN